MTMETNIEVLRGLHASIVAAVGDDDPEYVLQLEAIDAGIAALAALSAQAEARIRPDALDEVTVQRDALAGKLAWLEESVRNAGCEIDYSVGDEDCVWNRRAEELQAQQAEAQAGGEVDVTGFGTPPLMHDERADAEKVYSLTAFDYAAAPIGSRDWTIYWRGWWHRSLVYGDTTPPPGAVPEGMVLVRESMLRHWLRELNGIRNGDVNFRASAEHVHSSISSVLAAAPGPKEDGHG